MKLPRTPLALAALLVATAGVGFHGSQGRLLATTGNGYVPHLDEDGDGLDNALEQRLGLCVTEADHDGDGYDDRTELLYGTDPNTPDLPGSLGSGQPVASLEAYATDTHLFLQVFAQHATPIQQVRIYVAREHVLPQQQYFSLSSASFLPFLDRMQVLPALDPQFQVTSARFRIPLGSVQALGTSFALAVQIRLGGVTVADQISFTTIPQTGLTEVRQIVTDNGVGGGGSGGPGTGGLFPADPNLPPPPDEVIANQVCVQHLAANGTLGAGGILYQVTDAYCDSLLEAECPTDCASATGSTVIGIDIASLIQ